jgi:hypothetical protein
MRPYPEHKDLTANGINDRGFEDIFINAVIDANVRMDDGKDPRYNWKDHYQWNASNYSNEQFNKAVYAWNNGNKLDAAEHLGRSLHAKQDSNAHVGLAAYIPHGWMNWVDEHLHGLLGIKNPDRKENNPKGYAKAQKDTNDLFDKFDKATGRK